jgi:salicylate hydroxylase
VELMTKAFGSHSRIAIIGAGIGGLTFSIAHGVAAEVFEQAHELTEIRAAVALSANGTRELDRFGLLDQLGAVSTEPTELIYRDGRTGERIAAHPVRIGGAYGESGAARHSAACIALSFSACLARQSIARGCISAAAWSDSMTEKVESG